MENVSSFKEMKHRVKIFYLKHKFKENETSLWLLVRLLLKIFIFNAEEEEREKAEEEQSEEEE